jgi:asparagine synthase (glutamine-hydrolysing)
VSFSGGRESAWLLAAATAAARSQGHADPIPATLRYAGSSARSDALHQEEIVSYLQLGDWVRVEITDELEMLGPYARRAIADAGLLFPATAYAMLPLLDRARGGWLVAGGALADFFTYWRWARLSEVLAGRRRPRRRDLRDLASAARPRRSREARLLARVGDAPPWLSPEAAQQMNRLLASAAAAAPLRFAAAVRRQRTHRCHTGMRRSFEALASVAGARFAMPFRDDRFIAALAAAGGRRGFGDRSSSLLRVAGHLLPPELLRRSDGVNSRQAFFGDASRRFAEEWTGDGVANELVNPEVLRALWSAGSFPWTSTMLFQLAFRAQSARTARTSGAEV